MKDLAILITCHNRKDKTLKCLDAVFDLDIPSYINAKVLLLDDGSSDGTSEAVGSRFPQVEILSGSGDLYWAGGMRKLISHALEKGYDYYLWLNDDTYIFQDSLSKLFIQYSALGENTILSGATKDPETGQLTYGGFVRKVSWSPLHLKLVAPDQNMNLSLETLNGNCVLLSHQVLTTVGNLDPYYTHGLADLDYGFKAHRNGVEVYLSKMFVGFCRRNEKDRSLNAKDRLNKKASLKNMPLNEWKHYVKRNGGILWPYYFIAPYVKSLIFKS